MQASRAGAVAVIGLALIILAACAAPLSATAVGGSGCHPASPIMSSANQLPEVRGQSSNGELWALLFNSLRSGQEIKIVWRMTGTGDLHVVAVGPQGQRLAPAWGPQAHLGSNWERPGGEWGTGFTFPTRRLLGHACHAGWYNW